MIALRALLYADWRSARNDVRRIMRSPGRIVLWSVYTLGLAFFVCSRFWRAHAVGALGPQALASADYAVCGFVAALVFSLGTGRDGLGIFRSRVEARFIIGSPAPAPLAIAYLQARESLGQSRRFLFSLIYVTVLLAPHELSAATVLADLMLAIGAIAAWAALAVPRRLLLGWAGRVCVAASIPLLLLTLAPAVRDAVMAAHGPTWFAGPILTFVPNWHPGRVLFEPNLLWLAGILAVTMAAIGLLAAAGRDAYPELYALAVARIERRERMLRRGPRGGSVTAAAPAATSQASRWNRTSSGVLAFVWKSRLEFGRVTHRMSIAGAVALSLAAGFAGARFARTGDRHVGVLLTAAVNLLVITGIGPPANVTSELRRPLFWLSPAPVFERLCALLLAHILPRLVVLECVVAGFALAGGSPVIVLELTLVLPTIVALVGAIAFVVLALFPNASDQRGPATIMRLVVSVLLLLPPAVLGTIIGALGAPRTGVFAAALLALIEAGALIGVTAWRLDGHIDRLLI